MKPTDDFSRYYEEHVEGIYECLDRIVINAYFPMGQTGGGMRYGWRKLKGNDDGLTNEGMKRMAGDFARRWRGWAKTNGIPVIDARAGEMTYARIGSYTDQNWPRDPRMRQVRVRATNPEGRTIELGILTDDPQRPAAEVIHLMFRRWLQENDFKYLEKHFGINQLTSYTSVSYREIRDRVEDKQMQSGAYKALEKERQEIFANSKVRCFRNIDIPAKTIFVPNGSRLWIEMTNGANLRA